MMMMTMSKSRRTAIFRTEDSSLKSKASLGSKEAVWKRRRRPEGGDKRDTQNPPMKYEQSKFTSIRRLPSDDK